MEDFFQRVNAWGHARVFKIVNCCNGNCDSPRIKYILFGQQIPRCNPKSLTKLCMTNIDEALSCHNALDCLIFADAINSTKLCRQARSFIIANKSHDAMKASWKKLDLDATKVCLEIILTVCKHSLEMSKDVVSYGFIRPMDYEEICLVMVKNGLIFENALSILLNAKRLGAKKLFEKVTSFMWLYIRYRKIKDCLKFLLLNDPSTFLEVGMIMVEISDNP